MKICIVGLGLIGGSFAKAISARTNHICIGVDADKTTLGKALSAGAIKEAVAPEDMGRADMVILALPPRALIEFFEKYAAYIKKGAVVFDTCGVKEEIIKRLGPVAAKYGLRYVGAHPMAGREFSGFDYSLENLFDKASFIVTTDGADKEAVDEVCALAREIGFGGVKVTDAAHHDRVIAYTSQLAHIVSNSYCKSRTIEEKEGFCAGSFADMTRVGKLDVNLWTQLFMLNIDALDAELTNLIDNLCQFKKALDNRDKEELSRLLAEGNAIKVESLRRENK